MFIFLSKTIVIPNNIRVTAIAWNQDNDFITVGGEGGFLKAIKLDSGNDAEGRRNSKGIAFYKLLTNQTLDEHRHMIQVITWNNRNQTLITSDRSGMILVWMLYRVNLRSIVDTSVALCNQNTWYGEMAINREESIVVDMTWSADSTKICIIYQDGGIIVGSHEGRRIWGKELKYVVLSKVQWSPDAKLLLFGFANGVVHIYDSSGRFAGMISVIPAKALEMSLEANIVGLDWYNGQNGVVYRSSPTLAICCKNGYIQLMRNEYDPSAIIVNTKMIVSCCKWNYNGSLLAVAGRQHLRDDCSNGAQFYTPFGQHLLTLKLPGEHVSCCTWGDTSLGIAFGVDSSVHFANIQPDYKWCYFKNTIAYSSGRLYNHGVCITFWDTVNNQSHNQYVVTLLDIAAYDSHCVMATKLEMDDPMGQCGLILCNTSGTIVDAKYVDFEIKWVAVNSSHVAAASKDKYILWPYKTPKSSAGIVLKNLPCHVYHTDFDPTGPTLLANDYNLPSGIHTSYDPICAIAISERYLIIGKESGTIKQFVVPQVVIVKTFNLSTRAHKMCINCNSTRLSVIDMNGVLTVLDISEDSFRNSDAENTHLERKFVWSMCWASDNPQVLAITEKTEMYIFNGSCLEEPFSTFGYICSFKEFIGRSCTERFKL